jgi:hypothetical protein
MQLKEFHGFFLVGHRYFFSDAATSPDEAEQPIVCFSQVQARKVV